MAGTNTFTTVSANGSFSKPGWATYKQEDGFDLIWRQTHLQAQMQSLEDQIANVEKNANMSDTEKMFTLQMLANTWNAVATARTNILKCVSDVLKATVRNIA